MSEKVAGVYLDKRTNKWEARIMVDGKIKYLGTFKTYEKAVKARKEAEVEYGHVPVTAAPKLNNKNDLTQEMLKELLHYDPETGLFTRKVRTAQRIKTGDVAGSLYKTGYVIITINNKRYLAHRLAFLYMEGKFPEEGLQVDHVNHVTDDNKWKNLRLVNHQGNSKNQSLRKNNKFACTGVRWDDSRNKYLSQITVNGENKHLGRFDKLDDAIAARKVAEIKYGFHENHGK